MNNKILSLQKAEDPAHYAKQASSGMMLGYPVKINGQSHRADTGTGYHSTIKVFNRQNDHPHVVHNLAQHLPLNAPDAKNTQIEPGQFKDRKGNDVFVIKLHGRSADKLKEHHAKFAHMGDPENYDFQAHISVPKDVHDKIKASGARTAHEAGIEFGNAELKLGPKTIKTYRHEQDTTEPKVPDEGDLTARVPAEPKMKKLTASEKDSLCALHKAQSTNKSEELHGHKPLMKPYVSEAQRRWAHTPSGKKALGGNAEVHEWDEAAKGKKLPEKVGKSDKSLEKGAIKNAGIALGMAGVLASPSHTSDAKVQSTPSIQHSKSNPYDHKKMLRAIASVESGDKTDVKHAAMGGMHHGGHAYGKYGLTEPVIKDTVKAHKDLKNKHGKVLALTGKQLHNYMHDNKGLEDIVADRHLTHMEHVLGPNPEHLGYGWLNGAQGALNAKNKGLNIKNHWHAKKIRSAYDSEK